MRCDSSAVSRDLPIPGLAGDQHDPALAGLRLPPAAEQ